MSEARIGPEQEDVDALREKIIAASRKVFEEQDLAGVFAAAEEFSRETDYTPWGGVNFEGRAKEIHENFYLGGSESPNYRTFELAWELINFHKR